MRGRSDHGNMIANSFQQLHCKRSSTLFSFGMSWTLRIEKRSIELIRFDVLNPISSQGFALDICSIVGELEDCHVGYHLTKLEPIYRESQACGILSIEVQVYLKSAQGHAIKRSSW